MSPNTPSSDPQSENLTGKDMPKKCRTELYVAAVAFIASVVAVVVPQFVDGTYPLYFVLILTVPLCVSPCCFRVFPATTYDSKDLLYDMEAAEESRYSHTWSTRFDVFFSFISFLAAGTACVAVVLALPNEFHPVQWPIDGFHIVSISFVSALVARKTENGWAELAGVVLGILATFIMLLTVRSYTHDWYFGQTHVDAVFTGASTPFTNVTRHTHQASSGRAGYTVRLVCASICAGAEFVATNARLVRFARSRCGERYADLPLSKFLPFGTGDCSDFKSVLRILNWLVILLVLFDLGMMFSPYPRWVVYDSRHTLMIAGMAYFSTPQAVEDLREVALALLVLGIGVVVSSVATVWTFDEVRYAMQYTSVTLEASKESMFSVVGYAREITDAGTGSFLEKYQYTDYTDQMPLSFAITSVATHAVDMIACAVGAGIFVTVLGEMLSALGLLTNPSRLLCPPTPWTSSSRQPDLPSKKN